MAPPALRSARGRVAPPALRAALHGAARYCARAAPHGAARHYARAAALLVETAVGELVLVEAEVVPDLVHQRDAGLLE